MTRFRDLFSDVRAAKITFAIRLSACIVIMAVHLLTS